jgi:hypothetical protein
MRNLEEKRKIWRPRKNWEDNIKIDPKERLAVWVGMTWLRIRANGCSYEKCDENTGSLSDVGFLEELNHH